jgi:Zn-dependent protease with chaperone function
MPCLLEDVRTLYMVSAVHSSYVSSFQLGIAKMFAQSIFPFLFCFLAQLISVSSSPLVVERAAATCSAKDIATVKRTTPDAVYFCQWWQQE